MTVVNLFGVDLEGFVRAPSCVLDADALDAALVAFFTAYDLHKAKGSSTPEDPLAGERASVASAIITYLEALRAPQ
jgi:hypothetical protein